MSQYGRVKGLEEGDHPAAESAFQKGIGISKKIGDRQLERRILAESAQVDLYHLHFETATSKARMALDFPDLAPDLSIECASLYTICMEARSTGKAIRLIDASALLATAERLGNRFWQHMALWIHEWMYQGEGNWTEARIFSDRGLELTPGAHTMLSTRTVLEFETGEFDRGMELLEPSLDLPVEYNPDPFFRYAAVSLVLGAKAWISGEGHNSMAREAAEVVVSSNFAVPVFRCVALTGIAFVSVMERDLSECRRLHDTLAPYQGTYFGNLLVVDHILGLLAQVIGELDTAEAHFKQAMEFSKNYLPGQAWAAHDYGSLLLERDTIGDRAQGLAYLDQAESLAKELGMPPLLERVQSARGRLESRPSAYPDGLTQREVEVLALIAAGKTDREIGEELVISVRTVTTHVGNILNKVGAANRTEAATYATRQGLI